MQSAVANADLLGLMCREKLLSANIAQEYLEAAQKVGKNESTAMLLEYMASPDISAKIKNGKSL